MATKKIKILLVGTGSLLNYGCEAIVQGTYAILKSTIPNCQIYLASDNPDYDSQVLPQEIHLVCYKKRVTPYRLYKGLLRRCLKIGKGSAIRMNCNIGEKYDVILSCGGDNYCEAPSGKLYHILLDLMKIGEKAVEYQKKYIIWGASIGPFHNTDNEKNVINNISKCSLINVREKITCTYLSQFNELNGKVKLIADPAFCMEPNENISFSRKEEKLYIGINISSLSINHSVTDSQADAFTQKLFDQLDRILKKNDAIQFICIPHVISGYEDAQDDYFFMQKYLANTNYKSRITLLPKYIGAAKTKGYIKQCDLLIAARMHCCVGGISVGTPTLFITYSQKGIGMSQYAYGHHQYEIACEKTVEPSFLSLVELMIAQKESIHKYLIEQKQHFIEDAMRGGQYLSEITKQSE